MKHLVAVASLFLLVGALIMPAAANAPDTLMSEVQTMQVDSGALDAVAFSPDGSQVATGGRDNRIHIWDAKSGERVRDIHGHAEWVTSIAFNHNGTRIASGSRDNSVRTFDTATGELLQIIGHHNGDITAVDYTADGSIIASGARDSTIMLHQADNGTHVATLDHFDGPVWDLAFSPADDILASASEDGTVWVWGLWAESGSWLKRLDGHDGAVTSLAWSPDGNYLLTSGLDSTIRLWDVRTLDISDTAEAIAIMQGHDAPAMGVGFSANGDVGISAGLDGTVRLWDVAGTIERGRELTVSRLGNTPLTSLALHPDYTSAASIGTDGTVTVWDTKPDTIRAIIAANRPAVIRRNSNSTTRGAAPQSSESTTAPTLTGRELAIPAANIRSSLTSFPLGEVTWDIDPWEPLVGHMQGTAWLNQTGNVVLGGHSEYPNGAPGIFNDLYDVGIGDEIFVSDGTITRRYVVVNVRSVNYKDVSVVYPTAHNRLTLITCDIPSYVAEQNIYYERLVVIADEVP